MSANALTRQRKDTLDEQCFALCKIWVRISLNSLRFLSGTGSLTHSTGMKMQVGCVHCLCVCVCVFNFRLFSLMKNWTDVCMGENENVLTVLG